MSFALGVLVGAGIAVFEGWWFITHDNGDPKWIVAKWWAENPERWAGLRELLIEEDS